MIQYGGIYRASGKILMAGGYGLLEEGNCGLALAVSKHFYSITHIEQGKEMQWNPLRIEVDSPQINSRWIYTYYHEEGKISEVNSLNNPFVQNAVKYALQYGLTHTSRLISKMTITILFDRGFLSENALHKQSKKRFINYDGLETKTGLGSSACVVVAVVGGILKQLLKKCSESEVNSLSQIANIAAQNKIGSNFDISTAVYGSQLYKNVLPRIAFKAVETGDILSMMGVNQQIKRLQPNEWLLKYCWGWMLDLRKGSNTRTMASNFIKNLHSKSAEVISQFYSNNKTHVNQLHKIVSSQLSREELVNNLKAFNRSYRKFIQSYSKLTNVPIEPQEFSSCLDELSSLDEVVYCLCPGSGGYDAIFVLAALNGPEKVQGMETLIETVCKKNGIQCQLLKVSFQWSPSVIRESQVEEIRDYLKGRSLQ